MISSGSSSSIVVGFSLTGSTISPGGGVLLLLNLSGIPTGSSGIIVSDPNAEDLGFTFDECNGSVDVGCGCGEPAPSGCDNLCGSTAVEDECGVCNGDGTSCAVYMMDVLYDSDTPIAGFQY